LVVRFKGEVPWVRTVNSCMSLKRRCIVAGIYSRLKGSWRRVTAVIGFVIGLVMVHRARTDWFDVEKSEEVGLLRSRFGEVHVEDLVQQEWRLVREEAVENSMLCSKWSSSELDDGESGLRRVSAQSIPDDVPFVNVYEAKLEEIDSPRKFYAPMISDKLCGESILGWHQRYGHFAEHEASCSEHHNSGNASRFKKPRVLTRPMILVPDKNTPVLILKARNALVQFEGRIFTSPGHSVQSGLCCYCDIKALALRSRWRNCDLPKFTHVISVASTYGSEYAHFVKEVLPRVVPFLSALRSYPSGLRLHLKTRRDEEPPSFVEQYFSLLGILPSQIVRGDVRAEEVWSVPATACGMAADNFWQLLHLRKLLLDSVGKAEQKPSTQIVLLERIVSLRNWMTAARDADNYDLVFRSIPANLRNRVVRFKDNDDSLMDCVKCQIDLFSKSRIVIGMHGAGLSNVLFMPPGSLVVEIGWPGQQSEYTWFAHVFGHVYFFVDWSSTSSGDFTDISKIILEYLSWSTIHREGEQASPSSPHS